MAPQKRFSCILPFIILIGLITGGISYTLFLFQNKPELFSQFTGYKKYDHAMDDSTLFDLRIKEVFPSDMAIYIDKYRMCLHWSGEEAFDEERGKQIDQGIIENCTGLENKLRQINQTHKSNTKYLAQFNLAIKELNNGEAFPTFMYNDPQKVSAILNEYYESNAQYIIKTLDIEFNDYALAERKYLKHGGGDEWYHLNDCKFLLTVQSRYLVKILNNLDRLQPITKNRILKYSNKLNTILQYHDK